MTSPEETERLYEARQEYAEIFRRANRHFNWKLDRHDRLEAALQRLVDRYTMRPADYRQKYPVGLLTEEEDREQVIAQARSILQEGRASAEQAGEKP